MRIKGSSQHNFSQVPNADIPRASFDRSCGFKTTFDAGYLVPVFVDEVVPGDTFNVNMTAFCRLATPLHPFMDNMYLDSFFFFVPLRLVWDNFQKFMGEQVDPGDSTDYLVPTMTSTASTGYLVGSIHDYFGLPTGIPGYVHMSLAHRAHNLIWNEWFRDQNLQDSVVVDRDDGPDSPTDYVLLRRGKRHDYFTSCLPWPQKGPAVDIPIGTSAPVYGIGFTGNLGTLSQTVNNRETDDTRGTFVTYPFSATAANGGNITIEATSATGSTANPAIYADLSSATAATINQLREAFQIQRLYERDARGGTRYTEIIRAHFGVTSPDARLQRPEYLGGGSSMLNVTPIAQTSETSVDSPQANLAAIGTATMKRHGFTKSFTEHGIILGFVCARADLNYQQGLSRMWSRSTRFDFYWPALSHIGEQTVLNKEIYTQGTGNPTQDAATFGYQERYAEYRYKPSLITGQFRSTFATSLDTWHLAQEFTALPVLNASFIVENPPVDRVIAVDTEPHFIFDSLFKIRCARPMPVFGVPGLIDHF